MSSWRRGAQSFCRTRNGELRRLKLQISLLLESEEQMGARGNNLAGQRPLFHLPAAIFPP